MLNMVTLLAAMVEYALLSGAVANIIVEYSKLLATRYPKTVKIRKNNK